MSRHKLPPWRCPFCRRDLRLGGHSPTCREGRCIECGKPVMIPGGIRCGLCQRRMIKDQDYARRQAIIKERLDLLDLKHDDDQP